MSTNRSSEETSIYIIDRDYRLVHFNHALKRRFKDVRCGDVCYEKLCGEDRPCQGCPLNQDSDGAVMFYNKAIQQWVEVSSGNMDWPGLGLPGDSGAGNQRGQQESLLQSYQYFCL